MYISNTQTEFELKDLFPKDDWEAMPNGDRRALGRVFFDLVKKGKLPIEHVRRGSDNHQRYKNKEKK